MKWTRRERQSASLFPVCLSVNVTTDLKGDTREGLEDMRWLDIYVTYITCCHWTLELFCCHGVGEAWELIRRDKQTSHCWRTRRPNSYFWIPCDRKVTQRRLHRLRRLTKVCADRPVTASTCVWRTFDPDSEGSRRWSGCSRLKKVFFAGCLVSPLSQDHTTQQCNHLICSLCQIKWLKA